MTKQLIILLIAVISCCNLFGQSLGLGTDTPHESAILDIQSSTKGVLIPSMSASQRNLIANPSVGLLVFDNDSSCFYFFDIDSIWQSLCEVSNLKVCDSLGATEVPVYDGSEFCESQITDNDVSVGINNNSPDASAILDIESTNQGVSFPNVSIDSIGNANPVSNPKEGLIIYNTNPNTYKGCGKGLYYWNGAKWNYISGEPDNTLIYTGDGF